MGNFLLIIGIALTVIQAMLKGYIKSVEAGGLIMIAFVFLIAARKYLLVKLLALAIPLYFFAKDYGLLRNQKDLWTVVFSSLPLFIMLFAYFIMFRGLFKK